MSFAGNHHYIKVTRLLFSSFSDWCHMHSNIIKQHWQLNSSLLRGKNYKAKHLYFFLTNTIKTTLNLCAHMTMLVKLLITSTNLKNNLKEKATVFSDFINLIIINFIIQKKTAYSFFFCKLYSVGLNRIQYCIKVFVWRGRSSKENIA